MSSHEGGADAWLARGIELYKEQRFAEAIEHFREAVAIDPGSVEAHLALGATHLTLYKKRPSPPSPDYIGAERDISDSELRRYREQEQAILAEQNSTNWALAEESLKRANRLDRRHKLVMEYLCALYFVWKDPLDEMNNRVEEQKRWFERLAETYPEHRYANYYCGMIALTQARKLLPNYGRFPRPPETEEYRRLLRTEVGPLLEQATRHLSRALTLDPEHAGALRFMADVKSMEAYFADTEEAAQEMRNESGEWKSKAQRVYKEQMRAAPEPAFSAGSGTIVFHPTPEALAEAEARPFPPNPWWI